MTRRLTELACARAKPVPGKRVEKYDGVGGVPGLASGSPSAGSNPGPSITGSAASSAGSRSGGSPTSAWPRRAGAPDRRWSTPIEGSTQRATAPRRAGRARDTFGGVVADYLKLHVHRNRHRSAAGTERFLRPALAVWGARPIGSITKRDVLDLIDDIASRAPVMACRVQSLLKRLFSWAVERGIVEASPLAGLRPPARELSRSRVLSDAELGSVWRACGELGRPFGSIVQLLVLTAARKSEVAGMGWTEIDFERRLWIKPSSRVKSGRPHEVSLSSAALDLITGLPRIDGSPWVFPARIGSGHTVSLGAAKRRLDELSGATGWRYHDLRRTTASGMARLGAAPHMVARSWTTARPS